MASTQLVYTINGARLTVMNIIDYMFFLQAHCVIPKFSLNFTDNEMHITIIYVKNMYNNLVGYTVIKYNINEKKWRSYINLETNMNSANIYPYLSQHYPYLVENNLIKVNFEFPFYEYILESEYIEDILEPSLNNFNNNFNLHHIINPRNILIDWQTVNIMRYYLRNGTNSTIQEIEQFYQKVDKQKKRVHFQTIKHILNINYFLPDELWNNIFEYIPDTRFNVIPSVFIM